VPVLLNRARISANEESAVAMLRTLITQENMFHKQDPDGNATNDYWAIDVSGMYRVLRQPAGVREHFTVRLHGLPAKLSKCWPGGFHLRCSGSHLED
jgi:hypothetical protein